VHSPPLAKTTSWMYVVSDHNSFFIFFIAFSVSSWIPLEPWLIMYSRKVWQAKIIQTLHYVIIINSQHCLSNFPWPNLLRTSIAACNFHRSDLAEVKCKLCITEWWSVFEFNGHPMVCYLIHYNPLWSHDQHISSVLSFSTLWVFAEVAILDWYEQLL